jgi:hypothetical protein
MEWTSFIGAPTMNINADLSQRAVVHSEELPWIDSPLPGV